MISSLHPGVVHPILLSSDVCRQWYETGGLCHVTNATPARRPHAAPPLHAVRAAKAALVAGVTDVAIDTPKPQRYNEKSAGMFP